MPKIKTVPSRVLNSALDKWIGKDLNEDTYLYKAVLYYAVNGIGLKPKNNECTTPTR